jgi:hypothetical protein
MYEVIEISLGNLTRLYSYIQSNLNGARFGLKGFDNPWLLESHAWKSGEKILDVGAAYSSLPSYLQGNYGGDVWAVDDFGMNVDDPFWTRNRSPQEFIESHPEVKYVIERLGDPQNSSLPCGYFDVIYSISVLEHVPQAITPAVWKHMDLLLKPGGEMLHAVDISYPSNGGLKKVLEGWLFDALYGLIPQRMKIRYIFATPKSYVRMALNSLGVTYRIPRELDVWNMVLNPDIVTEDYNHGLNRIIKDKIKGYKYQRVASLLFKCRKLG